MKQKSLYTIICTMAFALISMTSYGQSSIQTPQAASPASEVSQTIGISEITINYSRPALNGREGRVWGQLVPYGYTNLGFGNGGNNPWRAGANENTIITFSHNAKVEGKDIDAGSYGLHIGVFENGEAEIIFSKNTSSWGSYFYEKSEDELRVKVKTTDHQLTERLTYDFVDITPTSTVIVLDWEKKRFPFKVEFAVHDIVVQNAKDQLRGSTGFGFQGPLSAAQYCVSNNVHLDQALIWADQAVNLQKNANTLGLKGQILFATNKTEEAYKVMDEMVDHPSAQPNNFYNYGSQLISQEEDKKALALFEKMSKRWEGNVFAQHGMARAYSALGNFKKALKYENMVLKNPNLPANNTAAIQNFISKLEKGEDINP